MSAAGRLDGRMEKDSDLEIESGVWRVELGKCGGDWK